MKKISDITNSDDTTKKFLLESAWSAELLQFADDFSRGYTSSNEGLYISDNGRYMLKYVTSIDYVSPKAARISNRTGVIELDKTLLSSDKYHSDFVYYLIIWCIIENICRNPIMSDAVVIKFYLHSKRSRRNVVIGYLEMLKHSISETNKERLELVRDMMGSDDV